MTHFCHAPHFTFCFADNRIIPRFHLEGVEAGRRISVFKIAPGTGERLGLLATPTVGEGGWVDLTQPIIVRTSEAFVAGLNDVTSGPTSPQPRSNMPQMTVEVSIQGLPY